MNAVKVKIFLGYFTLVVLASLIVWIVYSEILQSSGGKTDFDPVNKKMTHINAILTNLYQIEGLERSYIQTGQIKHYQDYLRFMDTINLQIDTLSLMAGNPIQMKHTDSIKILLQKKQENLKELIAIKKASSSNVLYRQAIEKLKSEKDSIDNYLEVYRKITSSYDSVYIKQRKKKFFERLINVFAPQEIDTTLRIDYNQLTKTDSLVNRIPGDSVRGLMRTVITEIQNEGIAAEGRLKQKEQEVLANERTISLQLRQMLSNAENEELINSFIKVRARQSHVEKTTGIIIVLGVFALVTIVFFLLNILKDITRSQHYRKNLEEAKTYTESLLKSKEQLMISLTHDLKSPLNSVIGFAQLMEKETLVEQHKQYLQNIQKASGHIQRLINDLLDLARLDNGKLEIDHISFRLRSLIEDITGSFRPQALSKNIDLEFQSEISPSARYKSDPVRITQIVVNLISNAIKFTEKGKVTVRLKTELFLGKTHHVCIDVIDTGIGISKENIQHIFEEFGRVTTGDKKYEGIGLGLTITQKLVNLLNGNLRLESKPGEGSHFSIRLPMETDHQQTEDTTEANGENLLLTTTGLTKKRIWLVDDDQTLLKMTTAILRYAKMDVTPFCNPQEAVDLFERGCADLLITDIQMPGMNGFDLLKKIQQKNEAPIQSIAISGRKNSEDDYSMFSAFIQKPFAPQELLNTISGRQDEKSLKINSKDITSGKLYTLTNIQAFVPDDPEGLRQILISFIASGRQNTTLFKQYLQEKNISALSELSHKMLTLFRQLEAYEIIELLTILERANSSGSDESELYITGEKALQKIDELFISLQREENISANQS